MNRTKQLLLIAGLSLTPALCRAQATVYFGNSPNLFADAIDRFVYADFVGGT